MNVKEAAIEILKNAKQALSARELCERMLAQNLWHSEGKTPEATVAANLYTDIKKLGNASPFILVGPGRFGLRAVNPSVIEAETQESNGGQSDIGEKFELIVENGQPKPFSHQKSHRVVRKFSFIEAAEQILLHHADRKPMHYRDITQKALELDLLSTDGKTPEATMYAQILTETRRRQKRGEPPRFVIHGKGRVGLSIWMAKGLEHQVHQYNEQIRTKLRERLLSMHPADFEQFVGHRLLADLGFDNIDVTSRSRDGGIDVRGTLVLEEVIRIRMAVQVKRWKGSVGAEIVQQVRGSLGTHEQGLIITTGTFSAGARKEAARPDAVPVALMDGEQLVALLASREIGITRNRIDLFELADDSSLLTD